MGDTIFSGHFFAPLTLVASLKAHRKLEVLLSTRFPRGRKQKILAGIFYN